jgi:outer membrane protein
MMNRILPIAILMLGAIWLAEPARAQAPPVLSLAQADAIALKNHPRLLAAQDQAQAAAKVTSEVRSAYFPKVYGSATGVVAENGTRITAGQLNNPTVFDRYANGVTVNQMITDFGRTQNLTRSANYAAQSEQQIANSTRAEVLLEVNQAYYLTLQAQAVLRVAQQDVQERQVVADQVSALAKNKLKSELDVSFANVNLANSKLLLVKAQNDLQASFANLSLALGNPAAQDYQLVEEPLPGAPETDLSIIVKEALANRPEITAGRFDLDSARAFENAERDLWMPTLSAVAVAGLAPVRDNPLLSRYAAAGFNLNIPIFDGGLFSARHAEAHYHAEEMNQRLRETQNRVARDVRVAWLDANTAFQRLSLTQQLLDQAALALKLAEARYRLGLSSIVELNQAQLNETQAEIDHAAAKYQYQIANDNFRFQLGELR